MKIHKVIIFILVMIAFLIGIAMFNQTRGEDEYYAGYTEGPTCGHDGGFYYDKSISRSCITWGKQIYKCTKLGCHGYKVVYTVEPKKHTWVGQGTITVVPPTCEKEGYTEYRCVWCGLFERKNKVKATGHDDTPVTVDPTCTEPGYKESGCRTCKKDYTYEVVPALGHDWDREYYIAPTCKSMGFSGTGCRRCGEILTPQQDGGSKWLTIDSRNHVWDEDNPTVVKEGNCVEKGKVTYVCTLCGRVSREMSTEVNKDNHDYPTKVSYHVDVTCEFDGKDVYVCKRKGCGSELPVITEEKYGMPHDYVVVSETEATCTSAGLKVEECTKCGDIQETHTPERGHRNNGNGNCSVCGEELDLDIRDLI